MLGARITDAIEYYAQHANDRGAVHVVRSRHPDSYRWRKAVARLTQVAGVRTGRERMRIEEPVREVVVDLGDDFLRREVVIDARRYRVDLDRGEILPPRTVGHLRRMAFLTHTPLDAIARYVQLPSDWEAPVDVAGVVLVGRTLANRYRVRAQEAWLSIPPGLPRERMPEEQQRLIDRAERDVSLAQRWEALTKALLG